MVTQVDWCGAVTLEDHVIRLLQEGKVGSPEFQTLVRVFGKEKISNFIKKYEGQNNLGNKNCKANGSLQHL